MTAVLVLEDGRRFVGERYGGVGETLGEAVFSTGMTGYQETLTDPSYHGQIVIMTAPHVGNTGMNDDDEESRRIWVAGYVVREPARRASSWRARRSLEEELERWGIVGISGVDTRALTRHLRDRGAMRAGIFSGPAAARPSQDQLNTVRDSRPMAGAELASQVSTTGPYVVPAVGPRRARVAALDLGIKSATPRHFAALGVETVVLPITSTIEDVRAVDADGFFLSNGPGDPATSDEVVALTRDVLDQGTPVFGICFGHQVLARALELETYKLPFGHRGINQPVLDLATRRVEVTAHNHGFAVRAQVGKSIKTPYGPGEVSHVGLNDGVVEGLRCLDVPAFSVQYHPEAAAGPHDASHLFARFLAMITERGADA